MVRLSAICVWFLLIRRIRLLLYREVRIMFNVDTNLANLLSVASLKPGTAKRTETTERKQAKPPKRRRRNHRTKTQHYNMAIERTILPWVRSGVDHNWNVTNGIHFIIIDCFFFHANFWSGDLVSFSSFRWFHLFWWFRFDVSGFITSLCQFRSVSFSTPSKKPSCKHILQWTRFETAFLSKW